MPDAKLIGKDIPPNDLVAKITGRARFAEDFRADGMLFAKLLVSPMPHARVLRINASAALAMPGVEAILTADDLPKGDGGFGGSGPLSEAALTNEPVYEGEPILAVAAVDETTAADAIDRIVLDLEPLPFVIDPLESLRPGSPNARIEGNVPLREGRQLTVQEIKWPDEVFAASGPDELPVDENTEHTTEWSLGDLDAAFAEADLILDETIAHQSLTHHPLEPRSCMAYWQNGKLYLHPSTQSTAFTARFVGPQMGAAAEDVVFIAEYCGGGFGSKAVGSVNMPIPALLSQKTGKPVMMRVTRAEENYFGRARPGFQARLKIGFRNDGTITAIDLFVVQDNGPYGSQGDMGTAAEMSHLAYQPDAMRFRGITVLTNTPPRAAQRAPGGVQMVAMTAPLIERAARHLNVDPVQVLRLNAPDHDSTFGARQTALSSSYAREAIDLGAQTFGWEQRRRETGARNGSKVTGVGVALSCFTAGSAGFDGLLVIRPDGYMQVHQGIGNLGTHSVMDTARAAADVLDFPWEKVEIVWGNTSKHLPWTCGQFGTQTTHAHTRANHAAGLDAKRKLQELAAYDLGGSPDNYDVGAERVFHLSDRARRMSFARAAQRAIDLGGKYDGHEPPEEINAFTQRSVAGLAGQGLIGVARDSFPRAGAVQGFVAGFARVEVDIETGEVRLLEYTGSTDCGTVLNPRGLAAQIHGGAIQGFGVARSQKWVYDQQWGVPFTKGFHMAKPPTILDVPVEMKWVAVNKPDPHNPVGCKGVGEPAIGAGAGAVAAAIQNALGETVFNRTPITTDMVMAALEGQPQPFTRLTAHI